MEEQIDGDGNAAAIKRELAGRVCADVTANKRINNLGGEKRAAGSENPVEPGLSSNFLAKSLAHASTNRRKTEKWKAYEAKMERAFILLNEVAEIVNTVESQIEEGRKEEVEDEATKVFGER
ncbi:hypothetical protein HDU90_004679 [Geranomyces variabilis]|nr:hypothetical protein HDU90_004679 [Geranomyces variabilis]